MRKIFKEAQSSHEIIQYFYGQYQKNHRAPSIQNLAKKLNIPSKGYLSKILNGPSILSEKHIPSWANFFSFSESEKKIFTLLCQIEKNKKILKEVDLNKELKISRKIHDIHSYNDISITNYPFILYHLIFVHSPIKRARLLDILKVDDLVLVEQAIQSLINNGHIKQNNECLEINETKDLYLSIKRLNNEQIANLLEHSFDFTRKKLMEHKLSSEMCYYNSSFITIDKSKYLDWIRSVRESIEKMQVEIQEDVSPNAVISINIQAFPIDFD